MAEEKRKTKRISRKLIVRVMDDSDTEKKIWDIANIKDISEKGISVPVGKNFSVGQKLTIHMKIPLRPSEWTVFEGRVVSCSNMNPNFKRDLEGVYLLRLEFLDSKEGANELLRQYLALFKT